MEDGEDLISEIRETIFTCWFGISQTLQLSKRMEVPAFVPISLLSNHKDGPSDDQNIKTIQSYLTKALKTNMQRPPTKLQPPFYTGKEHDVKREVDERRRHVLRGLIAGLHWDSDAFRNLLRVLFADEEAVSARARHNQTPPLPSRFICT